MQVHPKYRADIDGLRAVAVLSVIIFHAFPTFLTGGFVGVDIFFVISGFLISTILYSSIERNQFTLADFYARRIRRIFPALLLVLASCYAFGWFALLAGEYKQLGRTMAAGAGFVANFLLWAQTGYFDNAAETKPLLHLWSLGIEEQFYLFWPLLLALAWKRGWSSLRIMSMIGLLSFGVNLYLAKHDQNAAFYSPLARCWELMIGSALAYIKLHHRDLTRQHKNLQAWLGVALLIAGFAIINPDRAFPGWWALLPTAGAFLLLSAGPQAWFNRRVLANKLMVWIGIISYPLYLWHWPLLSFTRILGNSEPAPGTRLAIILTSVLLAYLTYRLIEKSVRLPKHGQRKNLVLIALMLAVGILGYQTSLKDGFPSRMYERNEFIQHFESTFPKWAYFKRINLVEEWRIECGFFDGKNILQRVLSKADRQIASQ